MEAVGRNLNGEATSGEGSEVTKSYWKLEERWPLLNRVEKLWSDSFGTSDSLIPSNLCLLNGNVYHMPIKPLFFKSRELVF